MNMNMTRTTIKVRRDLLRQAKEFSFSRDLPLYQVVNDALDLGFKSLNDKSYRRRLFKKIDEFKRYAEKHISMTAEEAYLLSKRDLK